MGMPLTDLLEMEFRLMYYLPSFNNFDEREFSELRWLYARLRKQKKEENEQ